MRENDLLGYVPGTVGGDRSSARHGATPRTRVGGRSGGASPAAALRAVGSPPGSPVIGYASIPGPGAAARRELERQAKVIANECECRGVRLLEIVREHEPSSGKALSRPGLAYAMERIAIGEVSGLVVSELSRVTRSAAELGRIIEWLDRSHARFIAATDGLDTNEVEGHLAADLLVEVSRWESERLSERTRKGLRAARGNGLALGRPGVIDNPQLRERIPKMRAQGMTLQAIADRLNEEGVPTVRGGAKWRHSSVQAAAGYLRRPRAMPEPQLDQERPATGSA